jgi:hypothetical protein
MSRAVTSGSVAAATRFDGGVKRVSRQKKRGARRPLEYDSPKVDDDAYFFFDDFLLDFLAAAFFFAAIKLTTFHAVRDLTVAPTWQKKPDFSGQLSFEGRVG